MNRTPFIDHLRVAMTALVVFHHAAITYGASGGWYLREARQGSSPWLVVFVTLNQAFFMGFFFLIAGYFTPGSFDRKGAWRYAADRLLRLGVPLLVFGFLIDPFTVALARARSLDDVPALWVRLIADGWFSSGPLWFAQALLNFAAVYVAWRLLRPPSDGVPPRLPGHRAILLSALGVGAGAFVLRLAFPVGVTVSNLQFGYFSSYVFLFAVGTIGARGRWLERVDGRLALPWLAVSAVSLAALLVAMSLAGPHTHFAGGWTIASVFYAFFEPFFGWGVILGLLWIFHAYLNRTGRVMRFLSARAYTAYVIHPPLLVGAALALASLPAGPGVKFMLCGTIACVACVLVGSLVHAIPGARRVL